MEELETVPRHRLADALRGLAREAGWPIRQEEPEALSGELGEDPATLDPARLGGWLGVELWPIRLDHGELGAFLGATGPALLWPAGEPERPVAIVRGGRRWCRIWGEDGIRRHRKADLQELLVGPVRRLAMAEASDQLGDLDLPPERLEAARRALADEQIRDQPAVEGWRLELPPGVPFLSQLRNAGVIGQAGILFGSHVLSTLLLIASWWMIGRGALQGHLDPGWLWAWALLLGTTIPLRGLRGMARGSVALVTGALLKRRLLHGALRLEVEEVRERGAGEWLGRVIDSEHVESLALNGGFLAMLASLELFLAASVLLVGVAPAAHLGLLALWLGVLAAATLAYLRRRRVWTRLRLAMTHRLVERLVGHRTRLVQKLRAAWHTVEDRELEAYAHESTRLDRWLPRLQVLVPRGWLLTALVALLPGAIGGGLEPARLAVSLGGCLLALGALRAVAAGSANLAAAAIAWRHVEPLFDAAARPPVLGSPVASALEPDRADGGDEGSRLLVADGLGYRHTGRERDVLTDVSLELFPGDRVLLEGPSGGGKSTLVSLFGGLRKPSRGWLGLLGLDLEVWGENAWRHRVVCVPQSHENHLVTAPLAFNLLMGSRWPATAQDLEEAREVCHELGLGPLLERMPAGLMQPVGDSGWQLSQGERIRVYLARALLQKADLVIFDESFAGLDLENLERALVCADRRAESLLVVAHP